MLYVMCCRTGIDLINQSIIIRLMSKVQARKRMRCSGVNVALRLRWQNI